MSAKPNRILYKKIPALKMTNTSFHFNIIELVMEPLQKKNNIEDQKLEKTNLRSVINEINSIAGDEQYSSIFSQLHLFIKLRSMKNRIKKSLDLLLHVHGHQIFINGIFNADPHPGNILKLDDGRLGLIDYGQVKRLESKDRIALSKIIVALNSKERKQSIFEECIADAMRDFGFESLNNKNDVITLTAELYFDSNIHGRELGYPNPQVYYQYLSNLDPMVNVPPAAGMSQPLKKRCKFYYIAEKQTPNLFHLITNNLIFYIL